MPQYRLLVEGRGRTVDYTRLAKNTVQDFMRLVYKNHWHIRTDMKNGLIEFELQDGTHIDVLLEMLYKRPLRGASYKIEEIR